MRFCEYKRDKFAAIATEIVLEEGWDAFVVHLNKVRREASSDAIALTKADIAIVKELNSEEPPLPYAVTIPKGKRSRAVIGYCDRIPADLKPEHRFDVRSRKRLLTFKNHFERVWETYSNVAIMSVKINYQELVYKVDELTGQDTVPIGKIGRIKGGDFQAITLATDLGVVVYLMATEFFQDATYAHGYIIASRAVDDCTQLTGIVKEDDLETKLTFLFGDSILNEETPSANWGIRLNKTLKAKNLI